MATTPQFGVEALTAEAQALVHRMLDEKKDPSAITKAVRRETEEKVTAPEVARYAWGYWERQRQREQARKNTEHLVEQAQRHGGNISELLRAAFLEGFTEADRNGRLRKLNPLQLESAHRKRRELALKEKQDRSNTEHKGRELKLKEKQAELAERRVKVLEQRLQFDREKAQAALERLERKAASGEPLTPEDVRRIREIYGLYDDVDAREDIETEPPDNGNAEQTEA